MRTVALFTYVCFLCLSLCLGWLATIAALALSALIALGLQQLQELRR